MRHGLYFLLLLALTMNPVKHGVATTGDNFAMRDAISEDIKALITQLRSTDASSRQRAAFDLGRNGQRAQSALNDLMQLMNADDSPDVRVTAAEAVSLIEGNGSNAIPALKTQLRSDIGGVKRLEQQVERNADDTTLNALFDSLGRIEKTINVIASIGASAADAAPLLVDILDTDLGSSYRDLVPSVARALQAMGPAAVSILPDLEDYAKTKRGIQNRATINAAIDSIQGKTQKVPPSEPLTDIDTAQ